MTESSRGNCIAAANDIQGWSVLPLLRYANLQHLSDKKEIRQQRPQMDRGILGQNPLGVVFEVGISRAGSSGLQYRSGSAMNFDGPFLPDTDVLIP